MSHAIGVSVLIKCDNWHGSVSAWIHRQFIDCQRLTGVLVKPGAESGVFLPGPCFHLGDEREETESASSSLRWVVRMRERM